MQTIRGKSSKPTVLIVDDEALLRMYAAAVLDDAGYDSVQASNAGDAISVLESRTDIDIVFTDIEMPGGIDGHKLAQVIRDRWPPVKLILTSGKHRLACPAFE